MVNKRKIGFVFPGQGSQYVGMGKDIYHIYPQAKELFEKANRILNFSLTDLCFKDLANKLQETKNAQPAIFTVSTILHKILKIYNHIVPFCVAGHSLGEYSALVAAEVINFEDGLKIVAKRAELMQKCTEKKPGIMAAIIGLNKEKILSICQNLSKKGKVELANYNSFQQIVISGEEKIVLEVLNIAKELGAKKTIPLKVNGAFHSSLMQEAQEDLEEEIKKIKFSSPKIKFIPNVTADFTEDKTEIKKLLVEQITHSVDWVETILKMISSGVNIFIEIGPGKILSGLIKRISLNVFTLNIEDNKSLLDTLNYLKKNGT